MLVRSGIPEGSPGTLEVLGEVHLSSWRQLRAARQPDPANPALPVPEGPEEGSGHYCQTLFSEPLPLGCCCAPQDLETVSRAATR